MSIPATDKRTRIITLGDDFNGAVLLVTYDDDATAATIDIDPVGGADIRENEDGGIRLDARLAAQLARQLFELLTA